MKLETLPVAPSCSWWLTGFGVHAQGLERVRWRTQLSLGISRKPLRMDIFYEPALIPDWFIINRAMAGEDRVSNRPGESIMPLARTAQSGHPVSDSNVRAAVVSYQSCMVPRAFSWVEQSGGLGKVSQLCSMKKRSKTSMVIFWLF